MTERTPMEKLACIKIELVTLAPRLSQPYRKNIEGCIQYCRDLEEHLTIIDDDEEDTLHTLTLTVEEPYELDTIRQVLQNAEEEGEIDFSFGVKS